MPAFRQRAQGNKERKGVLVLVKNGTTKNEGRRGIGDVFVEGGDLFCAILWGKKRTGLESRERGSHRLGAGINIDEKEIRQRGWRRGTMKTPGVIKESTYLLQGTLTRCERGRGKSTAGSIMKNPYWNSEGKVPREGRAILQ